MSFRTSLIVLAACVALCGCGPEEPPETLGIPSGGPTQVETSAIYGGLVEEAQRLSHHSEADQLRTANTRAKALIDEMSKVANRGVIEQARLEAITSVSAYLDAAETFQKSRDELNKLMADAKLSVRDQKRTVDEKRAILRDQWPEFRRADDDTLLAERAYNEARVQFAAALKREKALAEAQPQE